MGIYCLPPCDWFSGDDGDGGGAAGDAERECRAKARAAAGPVVGVQGIMIVMTCVAGALCYIDGR
eukprot:3520293-Pyramimonas_sp.AAC.1